MTFLPQLHGGHSPCIIVFKQMLTRLPQPVAFLVESFVVNLVATVETAGGIAAGIVLIMLPQLVAVTDRRDLTVAVDDIAQPLPFIIGRHQIQCCIVTVFPIQPRQGRLGNIRHFMSSKKLGVAAGSLRRQLPHQGMCLTQDKPLV